MELTQLEVSLVEVKRQSQTAASSLLPKTVHRVVFLMHLLGQGPGVAVLGDEAAAAFRRLALPWEDGAVPGAPLGHPSAPAPSFLYPASNLDWRLVSYSEL